MSKVDNAFKIVLYLVGLGLVGMFVYLTIHQMDGTSLTLVAVALVFLMTRLGDIEIFKLFGDKGLVTEMRKAVSDTQATLAQLHEVAELFSRVTVEETKYAGRWGGRTHKMQDDTISQIAAGLRRVGVADAKINAILEISRPVDRFDYFHAVMRQAMEAPNEQQRTAYDEWSKSFIQLGIGHQPDPTTTEEFLNAQGLLVGETAERLTDYRQYWDHGTHRRKNLWDTNYRGD